VGTARVVPTFFSINKTTNIPSQFLSVRRVVEQDKQACWKTTARAGVVSEIAIQLGAFRSRVATLVEWATNPNKHPDLMGEYR